MKNTKSDTLFQHASCKQTAFLLEKMTKIFVINDSFHFLHFTLFMSRSMIHLERNHGLTLVYKKMSEIKHIT